MFAQQKMILHNPNNYPVWVATGSWSEGVTDLTGGGNHGPDSVRSSGWHKIPPKDAIALNGHVSYLHVRAYSLTTKVWFQVRPNNPAGGRDFFYELGDFNESFQTVSGWRNAVAARGGELKAYYPPNAYFNAAAKRYELTGPQIQGGEPAKPLPAAVATATFTNQTGARVFFTVTTGGERRQGNLGAGQSASFVLKLGATQSTVSIAQNAGGELAFSLPQGGECVFRTEGGRIKIYTK